MSEFGAMTVSQTKTAKVSAIARAMKSINIQRAVLDMVFVLPARISEQHRLPFRWK